MDVYFLRHAIAADRTLFKNDFDRPLTPEGEQKLRQVVKAMRNLQLSFDLVLSSPYVRARETAEIVAAALGLRKQLEFRESLGVDGSPREFLAEIRQLKAQPASLLLVGHEPYLSSLISLLITGTARSSVRMKKAGLCKLTCENLAASRCATLEWLLTPRQMLLMA